MKQEPGAMRVTTVDKYNKFVDFLRKTKTISGSISHLETEWKLSHEIGRVLGKLGWSERLPDGGLRFNIPNMPDAGIHLYRECITSIKRDSLRNSLERVFKKKVFVDDQPYTVAKDLTDLGYVRDNNDGTFVWVGNAPDKELLEVMMSVSKANSRYKRIRDQHARFKKDVPGKRGGSRKENIMNEATIHKYSLAAVEVEKMLPAKIEIITEFLLKKGMGTKSFMRRMVESKLMYLNPDHDGKYHAIRNILGRDVYKTMQKHLGETSAPVIEQPKNARGITEKIHTWIGKAMPTQVISAKEYADYGVTYKQFTDALIHLATDGHLTRIKRGVYCKPAEKPTEKRFIIHEAPPKIKLTIHEAPKPTMDRITKEGRASIEIDKSFCAFSMKAMNILRVNAGDFVVPAMAGDRIYFAKVTDQTKITGYQIHSQSGRSLLTRRHSTNYPGISGECVTHSGIPAGLYEMMPNNTSSDGLSWYELKKVN